MKLPSGFVGFASFILVAWCRLSELSWLLILSLGRQWRRRRGTAEPAGTGSGHRQRRAEQSRPRHPHFVHSVQNGCLMAWHGAVRGAATLWPAPPATTSSTSSSSLSLSARCCCVCLALGAGTALLFGFALARFHGEYTSTSTGNTHTHTQRYSDTHGHGLTHMNTCTYTYRHRHRLAHKQAKRPTRPTIWLASSLYSALLCGSLVIWRRTT